MSARRRLSAQRLATRHLSVRQALASLRRLSDAWGPRARQHPIPLKPPAGGLVPSNAFEVALAERPKVIEAGLDRLRTRLNSLLTLIVAAAVANVVLGFCDMPSASSGHIHRGAIEILSDIARFTRLVVGVPLRGYQVRPLRPIVQSVLQRHGREYLLVFPRQSGKNEAVAQLLVYLMNLYQRAGGNIIYGATGQAGLGMAMERLESRLRNPWNRTQWVKRARPDRYCLGNCQVRFMSTHPTAEVRGQTADRLLVIDEAQDQVGSHIEAAFTPMRAAHNATALYIGTVRTTSDFLWWKKRELEAEQASDGHQRVFQVGPHQVIRAVPDYGRFLEDQVRRYGRHHPIVASEYFLEPIDSSGGLFPPERRLLMRGTHLRQHTPVAGTAERTHAQPTAISTSGAETAKLSQDQPSGPAGHLYVATVDVAGEDEAATDPLAQLERPGRDYTVATVFDVLFPGTAAAGSGESLPAQGGEWGGTQPARPLPAYRAVDVFVDQGSKHFQGSVDAAGAPVPPLAHRLRNWLEGWGVAHVVADASGVGQGLVSWLQAAMGSHRVTGFQFSSTSKAALGSGFVALVESGRFQYWTGDEDQDLSDGWWFWRQVEACGYELAPGKQFDRDLRWEVPPSHRTDTPAGRQPTHDDRLVSAALVAEIDRLFRAGRLGLGIARSSLVEGVDPLEGGVY